MKRSFLRSLAGLACALLITAAARAQSCDPDQSFPTGCLCIYFCHSAATANNECSITVNWTTGYEAPGDYFEIWRTYNTSQPYSLVTTVPVNYVGSGGSYNYTDNNPPNPDGGPVYYYLKMYNSSGVVKSQTPVRTATPTCAVPNSCSGIYTQTNLTGKTGDVIVLKLSYGGYVSWNGVSNGAGAAISINCAGQSNGASTAHYYGSSGFSLSTTITITMPANTATISTSAVVNNSSTMYSSTATLSIVSVNGVAQTTQAVVCGGNSQGGW